MGGNRGGERGRERGRVREKVRDNDWNRVRNRDRNNEQRGAFVNWRKETVFVTGATGFIGGRVCERMMQAGVPKVRALVHGMHRASRIARMPVELCPGDLLERGSLREALGEAKVVIHCGVGSASGIVRETENMLAVAHEAGGKGFI